MFYQNCLLGGEVLDYQGIVNGLNKIGSVLSVEINSDGSYGDICVEAANDTYLQSVNVKREEFVPGKTVLQLCSTYSKL